VVLCCTGLSQLGWLAVASPAISLSPRPLSSYGTAYRKYPFAMRQPSKGRMKASLYTDRVWLTNAISELGNIASLPLLPQICYRIMNPTRSHLTRIMLMKSSTTISKVFLLRMISTYCQSRWRTLALCRASATRIFIDLFRSSYLTDDQVSAVILLLDVALPIRDGCETEGKPLHSDFVNFGP